MRWIMREYIDGFLGLMTDNLVQLIVTGALFYFKFNDLVGYRSLCY